MKQMAHIPAIRQARSSTAYRRHCELAEGKKPSEWEIGITGAIAMLAKSLMRSRTDSTEKWGMEPSQAWKDACQSIIFSPPDYWQIQESRRDADLSQEDIAQRIDDFIWFAFSTQVGDDA